MILGLTGAFGGGKSTVLDYFRNHGWHTFDADAVCHGFYRSGNPVLLREVRAIFGDEAVAPDGSVNRKLIAETAFKAPEKLQMLTGMIYPLLNDELNRQISDCRVSGINGIFELPLLYEADYKKCFDAVLAIWCDPELRCQRLKKRNFTKEEMIKRDARQLAPELKLEYADFAVVNNGSQEMLFQQLDRLIAQFE